MNEFISQCIRIHRSSESYTYSKTHSKRCRHIRSRRHTHILMTPPPPPNTPQYTELTKSISFLRMESAGYQTDRKTERNEENTGPSPNVSIQARSAHVRAHRQTDTYSYSYMYWYSYTLTYTYEYTYVSNQGNRSTFQQKACKHRQMSVCACVCACVCAFVCVCESVTFYLSLSLFLSVFFFLFVSFSRFVSLSCVLSLVLSRCVSVSL